MKRRLASLPLLACLLLLCASPAGAVDLHQPVSFIDGLDQGARLQADLAAEAATMRNGPGTLYDAVTTVWAGERLRYLDTLEGWVRVETASRRRGWLTGSAVHLRDAQSEGRYQITPGSWRMTAPGGASATITSVTLKAGPPGVLTLTLEGSGLEDAFVGSAPSLIRIRLGKAPGWSGRLKVADHGVETITTNADGVSVETRGAVPSAVVLEQSAERMAVQLRPRVDAIIPYRQENGAEIYHIALAGATRPVTRASEDGRAVTLHLPGALPGSAPVPEGVTATRGEDGVSITIPSVRQYALRPASGGLDLVFHAPGVSGKVVVLDPGHGGSETGAVSPYTGMTEKEINLDVALRLQPLLEAMGARVILTRTTDAHVLSQSAWDQVPWPENPVRADLHERVRIAEASGADLLLSIHHNAGEGSGAEVYYSRDNLNHDRSRHLAALLQTEFVEVLERRDRGFRPEGFYVTRFPTMPAALTEGGFLTDRQESLLLASPAYRQRMAESLAAAIKRYFQDRAPSPEAAEAVRPSPAGLRLRFAEARPFRVETPPSPRGGWGLPVFSVSRIERNPVFGLLSI